LRTSLAALTGPIPDPESVTIRCGGAEWQVPYRLLAALPFERDEQRFYRVVHAVIEQALRAAKLGDAQRQRCGLFIGSSSFDIGVTELRFAAGLRRDPDAVAMSTGNSIASLAEYLIARYDFRGGNFSFSTACSGSANALIYADAMVRAGMLDHALVLGVELFNDTTVLGFLGLQLLSDATMRPFGRAPRGMVIGEGCSALVVSAETGAQSNWQLLGSANQCDTFGMASTNPDGSSVAEVLGEALDVAKLLPSDIAAIKTHGTATTASDEAEVVGMKKVFGALPPLTALKPWLGHTLGASGLNELLLFCAAAEQGFLVPTPGIDADESSLGVSLAQSPLPLRRGRFMLNTFGFGGSNTSLILSNLQSDERP
jgi:3-oxoacyl-[acyl-carrier-protein] synthase-1